MPQTYLFVAPLSAVYCASAVQFREVQFSLVHFDAVQYNAFKHGALQFSAVQCSSVQCGAVWCSVVQCGAVHRCKLESSAVHVTPRAGLISSTDDAWLVISVFNS